MEQSITNHRLHPSCALVLNADGSHFTCAACKRGSSQTYRYSCDNCPFDVHGQCVTSPKHLYFWGHPHHPLELVDSAPDLAQLIRTRKPEVVETLVASSPAAASGRIPVYCDICTNEIEGMHYQCAPCGVFLHPVCTQLPVNMDSGAHREHKLTLVCSFPSMCRACIAPSTWAYVCFRCLARFHANCIPEYHHMLGTPYTSSSEQEEERNSFVHHWNRIGRFGMILGPTPPLPPRMLPNTPVPFADVNPLGFMDPLTIPRRGPSTSPSVKPDPCGGAFPFSGEYGRSTFSQQGPPLI